MKQIIYFTLAAIVVVFTKCEAPQKKTLLSGKILHPVSEEIELELNDTTLVAMVDSLGRFALEMPLSDSQLITFSHGGKWTGLYLFPGQNLELFLDTEAFDETLEFPSGDDHNANKYLAAKMLMDTLLAKETLYGLEEAAFLRKTHLSQQRLLSALEQLEVSDETFKELIRENNKWQYALIKTRYKSLKKRRAKTFRLSDDFLDFQNDLDINDTTQLKFPYFEGYVYTYMNDLIWSAFQKLDSATMDQFLEVQYNTIQAELTAPAIKRPFLFDMVRNYGSSLTDELFDQVIADWRATGPDQKQVVAMESILAVFANTKPGKQAPAFNYLSYAGDSVSLVSLAGKLVYIDVWATWCGPCVAEHPALEKLQEEFAERDIAFVSVSIDGSMDPWRKMVEKKQLSGIQLYAPGAWESDIAKNYGIHGIPRFILIDQEGKIIDADAERPSGAIGEMLEKHLEI